MSLRDDLLPDESILVRAQLHWATLIPPAGVFALAVFGAPYLSYLGPVLQAAAVAGAFVAFLRRLTTHFWVTDRRVLWQEGILNQRTEEMRLDKLVSVFVAQGVPGRLLGYGTITVHGAAGSWEPIRHMDCPRDVRHVLAQAIRQQPAQVPPSLVVNLAGAPDQAVSRLSQLERDRDMLTRIERLERVFRRNLLALEPPDSARLLEEADRRALLAPGASLDQETEAPE